MEISLVGSGYVGTTIVACLADDGHSVVNVDVDDAPVDAIVGDHVSVTEPPGVVLTSHPWLAPSDRDSTCDTN